MDDSLIVKRLRDAIKKDNEEYDARIALDEEIRVLQERLKELTMKRDRPGFRRQSYYEKEMYLIQQEISEEL